MNNNTIGCAEEDFVKAWMQFYLFYSKLTTPWLAETG